MTIVDTNKRTWRVTYRDELGRRCHRFVNGETEVAAVQNAGLPCHVERVVEIDPNTGREVNSKILN